MHCCQLVISRVMIAAAAVIAVGTISLPRGSVRICHAEDAAPPPTAAKDAVPAVPPPGEDAAAKAKADKARMEAALKHRSPVGPFTDKTAVEGKIPVDLSGVWLVVATTKPSPQHAPDKFQSFVQLVKVTGGASSAPVFHTLDVQLPDAIQTDIDKARGTLTPWKPTAEQLATLKKSWSTLPAYKEKTPNQPIFLTIDYTLIAPDHYKQSLLGAPPELLDKSTFALRISERYRPAEVPQGANIAQLMGRDSIYAFKADGGRPDHLNGTALVKFTVAGAGFPLPLSFGGQVHMYKLGTASS